MLPMKSFVYGPLEYDMEKANVSIGRLSCFGLKDSSDVSSLPEIVEEMKWIEGELIERTQTNREKVPINIKSVKHYPKVRFSMVDGGRRDQIQCFLLPEASR